MSKNSKNIKNYEFMNDLDCLSIFYPSHYKVQKALQTQKNIFCNFIINSGQHEQSAINTQFIIMDEELQLYKIVIIGNSGTGKTNISTRYMKNEFHQGYKASVGVEFFAKKINNKDKEVKITLWDTAGQQRFKSIGKVYYKGARAIIAVYDITDPQSYVDIKQWLRFANEAIDLSSITVFVVGNKLDLQNNRKITQQRVFRQYQQQFDLDCWEVSAKTGQNVNQMFESIFEKIYQKGIQVKSSGLFGDSQYQSYSEADRQSIAIAKAKFAAQQKEMPAIGQVIIEQHDQNHMATFQKMSSLDFEKKLTLTHQEQMTRVQQSKKKKKCCI